MAVPEFAEPGWFWLLLALPAVIASRWHGGVAESQFKRVAGTALRCLTLAALIVALAGPLAGSYSRHTDVIFALDVSRSIGREQIQDALAFIRNAWEAKQPGARMGLVVFGAAAELEILARADSLPVDEVSALIETDNTNIAAALETAIGAFPAGEQRRIVLLSDGRENIGNATAIAAAARSIGVEIYTIALRRNAQVNEVRVEGIAAPTWVRANAPFELQMTLHSNRTSRANLVILRNGTVLQQREIELQSGTNAVTFIEQIDRSGLYEYEAIINSDTDAEPGNNRYQTFVQVRGAPRVLHVVGDPADGDSVTAALRTQKLTVDRIPATALPGSRHQLADYDLIILNNVSGFSLSIEKMELLEAYVRDSGGGLINLGGDRSYGAGGYYNTPLENLLPVTMDLPSETQIPSLVVTMILDKSGSMSSISEGESKLAIAKRAALAALGVLNLVDRVGVLAFDANFEWNVPITEAANHNAIRERLRSLAPGGGTNLLPALEEAQRVISQEQAIVKHLILLSDGLAEKDADFSAVGKGIAAAGMTMSTVALGRDADQVLMAQLAAIGGGRFYHTDDPGNIPRIFTSETLVVARDLVVEQVFTPALLYPGEMLKGFGLDQPLPALAGYQRTFPKPAAQVLLGAVDDDPLLVSWRFGLGKAVAFMSGLDGRWGREWLEWPEFSRLIAQMARWTMRRNSAEQLLPTFRWQGQDGEILIDALDRDERYINGLELSGVVNGPDQETHEITLRQIAPGQYKGVFPVTGSGRYYVNLDGVGENVSLGPNTFGLAVPYSSEFVHHDANVPYLRDLAAATAGRFLPMSSESALAVNASKPGAIGEHWRIWWPFVLGALLLLLIEVGMRKINFP